jgi:hypothetical protein
MTDANTEAGMCKRMAQVNDLLAGGGRHFGLRDIADAVFLNKVDDGIRVWYSQRIRMKF